MKKPKTPKPISVSLSLRVLSNGAWQEGEAYNGSTESGGETGNQAAEQRRAVGSLLEERGGEGITNRTRRRRPAPSRWLHQIAHLSTFYQEQEGHVRSGLSNTQA
jgi:hypothetical protein